MNGPTIRIKPITARAERFQRVFGRLTGIPVVHNTPTAVTDPADGQTKLAYVLNTAQITASELTNLVSFYAELLNVMPSEVRQMIKDNVVLIMAADCEVEADHAA